MNRGSFPSACFAVLLLAASVASTAAHAANSAAGIYKGTYASYRAGGDYGTVTILINDQGGTTCDFFSTPNGYGTITTDGSVTSTAPFLDMSCAEGIGGDWSAASNSSSLAGGAITGSWMIYGGIETNSRPEPTGSFEASYVSALTAINPAAMAGAWEGGPGAFNFLPADAGLVISFIGWTNEAFTTTGGQPVGPVMGSPIWLLSGVGPTTIFPGTPVTLSMFVSASPPAAQPSPTTVIPWGSMSITFLDCRNAVANLSGPWVAGRMTLRMLAGVARAPGCGETRF